MLYDLLCKEKDKSKTCFCSQKLRNGRMSHPHVKIVGTAAKLEALFKCSWCGNYPFFPFFMAIRNKNQRFTIFFTPDTHLTWDILALFPVVARNSVLVQVWLKISMQLT